MWLSKFLIFVWILALGGAPSSYGFSIWNRHQDDSVCDLAPDTTSRLGHKPFVPDGTRRENEIYERLAVRVITRNCKNGQVLILDTTHGLAFAAQYFRAASNRLCAVADVKQVPTSTQENPHAFQFQCTLTKVPEAAEWLAKVEAEKTTEAMIAEGAPTARPQNDAPQGPGLTRRKCGSAPKLATILSGGGDCEP
jgi:hypothetical protein